VSQDESLGKSNSRTSGNRRIVKTVNTDLHKWQLQKNAERRRAEWGVILGFLAILVVLLIATW
jgi:hypothetical protein